jgi:hypothetical protein
MTIIMGYNGTVTKVNNGHDMQQKCQQLFVVGNVNDTRIGGIAMQLNTHVTLFLYLYASVSY